MTPIHRKNKALLDLSKRDGGGGKRCDGWGGPGTSAGGIERVAGLEDEQGKQDRAKGSQESENSSHGASYHELAGSPVYRLLAKVMRSNGQNSAG